MYSKLLPSISSESHIQEGGEIKPAMYRNGKPRQYRFNASTGVFSFKGEYPLTKAGKEFKLIPLAYRIFEDDLFDQGWKKWAEIYFLNESNQVCCLMFHGYSVDNLLDMESDMYYEDVLLVNSVLTVTPEQKESKQPEGGKYYIASFDFEKADQEILNVQKHSFPNPAEQPIMRLDTWNPGCEIIVSENVTTHAPPLEVSKDAALAEIPEPKETEMPY